ncbi:MAG: hypothetical protein M1835_007290, partial [Candelina submexicana]
MDAGQKNRFCATLCLLNLAAGDSGPLKALVLEQDEDGSYDVDYHHAKAHLAS